PGGCGTAVPQRALDQADPNRRARISTDQAPLVRGAAKLAEQVAGEVREHFGDAVLRTVIPRSVKVSEAPGYGMTILQYDAGSRGALAYLDAAQEINSRSDGSVDRAQEVEDDR